MPFGNGGHVKSIVGRVKVVFSGVFINIIYGAPETARMELENEPLYVLM